MPMNNNKKKPSPCKNIPKHMSVHTQSHTHILALHTIEYRIKKMHSSF